ncbi:RNA polymerase sigma factor [Sunxiuqinia sp. A32]|uniref:RNA polymerase sigma factor n=1 Tax=Sunxiuqinia sp. A32 TaxID=3461496 RepID=UPI00404529CA
MTKDSEIWEKFKIGDKTALSYIYFQNFELMFQYGIKFKDDPDFIKDCIQDVFFKLIKAGPNLSQTENIRYYLFRALKNNIYKELNKRKKLQLVEFEQLAFEGQFLIEDELSEKENASSKEKALLKALKSLSSRQREIIFLRYESGLDYDQICDIMDLKKDSARKLVYRAIKLMRDNIDDQLQIPIYLFFNFSSKYVF